MKRSTAFTTKPRLQRCSTAGRTLLLLITFTVACFAFAPVANGQAPPGALWYNGDLDVNVVEQQNAMGFGYNQCVSESNSHIYDDFNVPAPGWVVTDVFSDNLLELFGSNLSKIDGVLWEIRQGVSEGNPGTLVANGATYINYSVTSTGRSKGAYCSNPIVNVSLVEYRVMASGLNVFLAPGTYFLNVTPIGSEQCVFYGPGFEFTEAVGAAFNSGTNGASCGKVASTSIDGTTLTINLTKVSCNASHITVTTNDVKDSAGINLGAACLDVGLLLGDVNGDGVVDSADLDIVNSQIGQPTGE